MSLFEGFLFPEKKFSRFQGVQQKPGGHKPASDVPFWGFLISGKKVFVFSGGATETKPASDVPFWGFLISGKKVFVFSGGATEAKPASDVPF
jgi:hypothetical protein